MSTIRNRTCWICGGAADSREHKFKKSDLARSSVTWAPADRPYFISGSDVRRIQGPRSDLVTFNKVLCQPCNNTRTQPYDHAYEIFSRWVNKLDSAMMNETSIDFADVYGEDYQASVLNLVKYFAKHLGCRIATDDYTMPPQFASSLASDNLTPFEVSLSRSRLLIGLPLRGPGVLNNFPLIGSYSQSKNEAHSPYISGMIVGYLDVIYRYDYRARYAWEGDPIEPSQRTVRLGEYKSGASWAHPNDGQIPGSERTRRVNVGDRQFDIPILTPEHIKYIVSLGLPTVDMTFEQNLNARLKIAHAVLSPFYPEVTAQFLEDNLTVSNSDALWKCVFASSP